MYPSGLRLALIVCSAVALASAPAGAAVELAGVDYATGRIYRIPADGSAPSVIAQTGVQTLGALELLLDGNYYGITHDNPTLYRFDPITFAPTPLGRVTFTTSLFEGSIVQAPAGTVYITNGGNASSAELLTLDLSTRVATSVGRFRPGEADVNGLAWRSDGKLVGLDRAAGGLVTIDPDTGAATLLQSLPFAIGAVGGMTLADSVGYFVTAGPGSVVPGTNSLYSFDPFTGQATFVRSFTGVVTAGEGFGGLAVLVPEPGSALPTLAGLLLARRRSRRLR
jgi:hypothetical protein